MTTRGMAAAALILGLSVGCNSVGAPPTAPSATAASATTTTPPPSVAPPVPTALFPPPASDPAAKPAVLAIASFVMLELQYQLDGHWFYAPLVEVVETGGESRAFVTSIRASVPGVEGAPPATMTKCVEAGRRVSLLNEIYGDFELTIDRPGIRSPGGAGTVAVTYMDDHGRTGTVSASTPIVPGQLPTTYTGGVVTGACGTGVR